MRTQRCSFVIAAIIAFASTAVAQTPPEPSASPPQNNPAPPQPPPSMSPSNDSTSRFVVSGFVGSNFANNADPASVNLGGSIAYLVKDRYGLEFDAGFTPNFQLQNDFFGLGITPQVNSFMGNAVFAPSIGAGRWQPFVSGGVGAIALRAGTDDVAAAIGLASNDTRFGGNVGGGLMGFSGNWGIKADVRYFRASGSYDTSYQVPASPTTTGSPGSPTPSPGPYGIGGTRAAAPATNIANPANVADAALSGLHFWRANVGIAYRW